MAATQNNTDPAAGFFADILSCWQQLPNKGFFLLLLAAWVALFQFLGNATFGYIDTGSIFRWMWASYRDDPNGTGDEHGKLIPWIVLALFWWKRRQLLAVPRRVWWPALVLLAGALVLHLLGYLVQQPRVSIVALFGGIYALMGLAWGPAWLRASFFPFFLLGFCVPISSISQPITFPLRMLVARLVELISNGLLGLDVSRSGTQLFNPAGSYSYEVAAACSGLRSFIAILALCTIYGFVTFGELWKRLLMVACAFPLAVLGNTIRMLCIIVAAELSGQAAGNRVHESEFYSLLPYVPAIIGVMLIGHLLRGRTAEPAHPLKPTPI